MKPMMLLAGIGLAVGAAPLAAQDTKTPAIFADVVKCRAIADSAERLACFDRSVETLDRAEKSREVVVVSRDEVRTANRSLFGFRLPRIRLFSNDGSEDVKRIDGVIKSIYTMGDGKVSFTLADGARWVQTDNFPISTSVVRPGSKVTIKRGAVGSYFADFARSVTVRAKRAE